MTTRPSTPTAMSFPSMLRRAPSRLVGALGVAALAACGGGDDPPTTPPTGDQVATSIAAVAASDGQTAPMGGAVGVAPAVVVRDQNGQPMRGVTVSFAVTAGGGTVTGATAVTGSDGVARAGRWTLGATQGANTLSATATGGQNPSTTIGATARLPRWTFMVYLAADNNLAIPGLQDLEEMESIVTDADVQVVVQGEFNPEQFRMQGLTPATVNLPGYNTFRFRTRPDLPARLGPDGPVVDIGNRDMTDPAELREFVTWAKATHPAERYALVLWNHGGGFTGLIEDVTSSGSHLMSIGDLRPALAGVGPIDVLEFDMCLMGSYETLRMIDGLARVAVFSQELEPGAGNPYDAIVAALARNPGMDARELGRKIVESYDASYADGRASVTKSAYDMQAFATFDQALGTLAATMESRIPTLGMQIGEAALVSQKYEYPFFTDLGDFLDSLRVRTDDVALRSQIDVVLAQAKGEQFRIANRWRDGSDPEARPVGRSTGMHVTLPSGTYPDVLPDRGPGALTTYQSLFPDAPWTSFLTRWVGSAATADYFDQGADTRFEAYLVWDEAGVARGVDIDFLILEPNGNLYVPFLGTVTPNGHFTGDSYDHQTWYEGYLTNRFVEAGSYQLYALLFSDPQDFRPRYDLQFRFDQREDLASRFEPDYPVLSTEASWLDDPEFSEERLDAGVYTDFQPVAYAEIGVEGVAARRAGRIGAPAPSLSVRRAAGGRGAASAGGGRQPRVTAEQARTLRRAVRERRGGSDAGAAAGAAARRGARPVLRPRLDGAARPGSR